MLVLTCFGDVRQAEILYRQQKEKEKQQTELAAVLVHAQRGRSRYLGAEMGWGAGNGTESGWGYNRMYTKSNGIGFMILSDPFRQRYYSTDSNGKNRQ